MITTHSSSSSSNNNYNNNSNYIGNSNNKRLFNDRDQFCWSSQHRHEQIFTLYDRLAFPDSSLYMSNLSIVRPASQSIYSLCCLVSQSVLGIFNCPSLNEYTQTLTHPHHSHTHILVYSFFEAPRVSLATLRRDCLDFFMGKFHFACLAN